MADTTEQAKRILANTDEQIRRLIAAAATAGDLVGVDTAREVAGRIREILQLLERDPHVAVPSRGKPPIQPMKVRAPRGSRKRKSEYPKYFLRGGALCRLGWSRKQKEEYIHKAPKPVFDQTVAALSGLSKTGGGPFAAEAVIAEVNKSAANAIPNYQVYVAIGFLRDCQCVDQVGREGYHVPGDFAARTANAWRNTPESNSKTGD